MKAQATEKHKIKYEVTFIPFLFTAPIQVRALPSSQSE